LERIKTGKRKKERKKNLPCTGRRIEFTKEVTFNSLYFSPDVIVH